jgi:hypothetical protein
MILAHVSCCNHCRKPADKRCSKCRTVGYCSRECQTADHKAHKPVCKVFHAAGETLSASAEFVGEIIAALPSIFRANPFQPLQNSYHNLPMEQLVPYFQYFFLVNFQCTVVSQFSPAISVMKSDDGRTMTLIHQQRTDFQYPPKQSFVSFKTFCDAFRNTGEVSFTSVKAAQDDLMKVYLMSSFLAKCNQVTCCFGFLILRTLQTYQLTYQGERIVGWALQDGNMRVNHPSITKLVTVAVPENRVNEEFPMVMESLHKKTKLPKGIMRVEMQRNTAHSWLTFVVESGRIFVWIFLLSNSGQLVLSHL